MLKALQLTVWKYICMKKKVKEDTGTLETVTEKV